VISPKLHINYYTTPTFSNMETRKTCSCLWIICPFSSWWLAM